MRDAAQQGAETERDEQHHEPAAQGIAGQPAPPQPAREQGALGGEAEIGQRHIRLDQGQGALPPASRVHCARVQAGASTKFEATVVAAGSSFSSRVLGPLRRTGRSHQEPLGFGRNAPVQGRSASPGRRSNYWLATIKE